MKNPIEISSWLREYAESSNMKCLVVGISGGIDSALVSTLCAMTGMKTYAVSLPLHQIKKLNDLSLLQGSWLSSRFANVKHMTFDLSNAYNVFVDNFKDCTELSLANTKSRLRMTALYQIAGDNRGIVVGTGNKVEDFGIGFFTKYGDGGVDISPIGDMLKTEVWEMSRQLNIPREIIDALPTDGLWSDGRTDQDQIGLSYEELELAMGLCESGVSPRNESEKRSIEIYKSHRSRNMHKMLPIPVHK